MHHCISLFCCAIYLYYWKMWNVIGLPIKDHVTMLCDHRQLGTVCTYLWWGLKKKEWHLSLFIPFFIRTPETLMTCTCKQTMSPTRWAARDHTLVPTVPFLTLIPPPTDTVKTQKVLILSNVCTWTWQGGRGGSTYVQRVLVDDDEGHAVCHQTTGVTWDRRRKAESGRWERDQLYSKHR